MSTLPAWMALAYRTAMPSHEVMRIALGGGPDPDSFPLDVLDSEAKDFAALAELGVRLVTIADPDYPARIKGESAPILLQVVGSISLLHEPGVEIVAGTSAEAGRRLHEIVDAGGSAVLLLSKGMLKAKSLLRGLHQPIEDGSVVVVTAEPPRAAWGPVRDQRRNALAAALRR